MSEIKNVGSYSLVIPVPRYDDLTVPVRVIKQAYCNTVPNRPYLIINSMKTHNFSYRVNPRAVSTALYTASRREVPRLVTVLSYSACLAVGTSSTHSDLFFLGHCIIWR